MLILDTACGRKLDLDDPRPEQIALGDIAGGLSRICRFGAQSTRFHSVAQHAILVSQLVVDAGHPELALSALHHDSHEAYVCDIPSPLKRKLRDAGQTLYDEVCDAVDLAIHAALGLAMPSSDAVEMIKQADQTALMIEAADLLLDSGAGIAKATGLAMELPGQLGDSLAPDRARAAFLVAHKRLSGSSQTDHRPS